MKLVRYGERGVEKPGATDANGELRDLSAIVDDIAGEMLIKLENLKVLDLETLP